MQSCEKIRATNLRCKIDLMFATIGAFVTPIDDDPNLNDVTLMRRILICALISGFFAAVGLAGGPIPRPAPLPPDQVAFAFLEVSERLSDGKLVRINVSLDEQRLTVTYDGRLVAWSDITTGAAHSPTPKGLLSVQRKEEEYHSALFDVDMPHALFLTQDGIAIHGGRLHEAPASAGCIRVPLAFARWLYHHVQVGTEILIS